MVSNIYNLVQICNRYNISNLFDIGSRDGDDANYLASMLNIKDVYIFEPNPRQNKKIKLKYPNYNIFDIAISNFDGESNFFCIKENFDETTIGISSLKDRVDNFYENRAEKIKVNVEKFSTFCKKNNINKIDLVKIDVEGCTYEVLQGFESFLNSVQIFHLEAENKIYWEEQKLYSDVADLLKHNFKQEHFVEYDSGQSDSIWINKSIVL